MKEVGENMSPPKMSKVIETLRNYSVNYSHLGEDYMLSRICSQNPRFSKSIMRRYDGLTVIITAKGTVHLTVNLTNLIMPPCSIMFIAPETFFKPTGWDGTELDVYVLFMSNRFLSSINFDLNAVNTNLLSSKDPMLRLTPEHLDVLRRYFDLLHLTSQEDCNYSRPIARSLVEAAGYQLMAFGEEAAEQNDAAMPRSRRSTYVRNFLRLVRENHRSERAIGFYADRMFISPKYLSLIIKEATGKSAAEWIDQYVIQEAKNLLRYSGKNVQQIAYELNFTNQSSFGKYFKHLTGLSPTQFQHS